MADVPPTDNNQAAPEQPRPQGGLWTRFLGMFAGMSEPEDTREPEDPHIFGPEHIARLSPSEPEEPDAPAPEPAPQWPDQWKAPGVPRKEVPARPADTRQDGADPPPWPEDWAIIKSHSPRKQPPRRREEPGQWPSQEDTRSPREAPPDASADPPAWPEQWSTSVQPSARSARREKAADRPAPWDSQAPGKPAEPAAPGERAAASRSADPPEWPAEWAGRLPGSRPPNVAHPSAVAPPPEVIPQTPPEPFFWRVLRAVCDPLLTTIGFRRLREYTRADHVPPELRRMPELDEGAARRVMPLVGLGFLFALLIVGGFWGFTLLSPRPTIVDAENSQTLMRMAVAKLSAGDVPGARALRDRMREASPQSVAPYYFEGYLMAVEEGKDTALAAKLNQRTGNRRRSARNLISLAGFYEATGERTLSADKLLEAVRLDPRNLELRLLAASALLTDGRHQEAIAQADELDLRGGSSSVAPNIRGQAYLAMKRPREAREEFLTSLVHEDAPPGARLGLIDAHIALGDVDAALKQLKVVVENDPKSADAYARLGLIQEQAGDLVKAERIYRKAIALGEHPGALNNLAYLLAVKRNKPAEALPFAIRASKIAPDGPPILDTLGWTYHLLGRTSEALPIMRKAVKGDPTNPELRLHLAQVLLANGDRGEALDILNRIANEEPTTPFHTAARAVLDRI